MSAARTPERPSETRPTPPDGAPSEELAELRARTERPSSSPLKRAGVAILGALGLLWLAGRAEGAGSRRVSTLPSVPPSPLPPPASPSPTVTPAPASTPAPPGQGGDDTDPEPAPTPAQPAPMQPPPAAMPMPVPEGAEVEPPGTHTVLGLGPSTVPPLVEPDGVLAVRDGNGNYQFYDAAGMTAYILAPGINPATVRVRMLTTPGTRQDALIALSLLHQNLLGAGVPGAQIFRGPAPPPPPILA